MAKSKNSHASLAVLAETMTIEWFAFKDGEKNARTWRRLGGLITKSKSIMLMGAFPQLKIIS